MEEYLEQLKNNNSPEINKNAGDAYLIIIDRSIDPLTPVMHDFYYQPLLYDIFKVKNDKIEIDN